MQVVKRHPASTIKLKDSTVGGLSTRILFMRSDRVVCTKSLTYWHIGLARTYNTQIGPNMADSYRRTILLMHE